MHTTTLLLAVLATVRVLAAPVASHGGVFTITGTRTIIHPRAIPTLPPDTVDQDYPAAVGDVSNTGSTNPFPFWPGGPGPVAPPTVGDVLNTASPSPFDGWPGGRGPWTPITPVPSPTTPPKFWKTSIDAGPYNGDDEGHVAKVNGDN